MAAPDVLIQVGLGYDELQVTRTLNALANKANSALSNGINANVFTQPLGRITGKANEFQKSLAASNARVIAFGASVGVIHVMRSAFDKMVESTIGVEKALTDINVALNLSKRDLSGFSNALFSIANNTATSFEEASKAALEFSRHGLNVEETLKRTAAALALAKLSGVDYKEAVSSLTATINSFTKEALNADDVLNRLVAVGTKYAASAGDLANGLMRVAAVANDANVSLNQTLALIASAQQITSRGGAVIGNSFKSMFTRLQRPEVLSDLEAVGVAVRDADGKMRPMIEILKNLATTYEGLSSSQKSFVAETVGGVYQVNVLKAILSDLGGGVNIFSHALDTASDSAGVAQHKLYELNQTISASLIRTMNDVTQAASNVGNVLAGSTMRSGIDSFDSLIKQLASLSDSSKAKSGTGTEQVLGTIFQGALKGVSNLISGPGLQFGVIAIIKLFDRLKHYIIEAVKDVAGINDKEKQRLDIQKLIVESVLKENSVLDDLIAKRKTIVDLEKMALNQIKDANALTANKNAFAAEASKTLSPLLTIKREDTFANGYVPNLSARNEMAEARMGGYQAGNIINTTLRNGASTFGATVNSRETISTLRSGGLSYDFVNPPNGSAAGRRHAQNVLDKYGFNPYDMDQHSFSKGFVPNLVAPDLLKRLNTAGVSVDAIIAKAQGKRADFDAIPDRFIKGALDTFNDSSQTGSLISFLTSAVRKSMKGDLPPLTPSDLSEWMRGFVGKPAYPHFKTLDDIKPLITSIVGGAYLDTKAQEKINAATTLEPSDIQAILSRHGPNLITVGAYNSPSDLRPPQDNPNQLSSLSVGGHDYSIPTPVYGHRGAAAIYGQAREKFSKMADLFGTNPPELISQQAFGHVFGELFDYSMKGLGGSGPAGSPFDIYGNNPALLKAISRGKPFDAAELKASLANATNRPEKTFRTLAGEPGTGGRQLRLSGPVAYVPPLTAITQFDPTAGPIGILDADTYKKVSSSRNDFNSLIYAAVATGKGLKTNYGPMGSHKTSSAVALTKIVGGGFVTGRDDLSHYKQFILNKTDTADVDKGVFGLALAASSNIEGFYHKDPVAMMEAISMRARNKQESGIGSQIMAHKVALPYGTSGSQFSPDTWSVYGPIMEHLQKKFGSRFSYHQYANGFVPNLYNSVLEALSAENGATGGNGRLSRSSKLVSSDNPLGLAAIDKRYQSSADAAIAQHSSMGQSMGEIRRARTYGKGFVPNLAGAFEGANVAVSLLTGVFSYNAMALGASKAMERLKIAIPILSSAQEREAIAIKNTIENFHQLRNELLIGKRAFVDFTDPLTKQNHGRITDVTALEAAFAPSMQKLEATFNTYQKGAESRQNRIQGGALLAANLINVGGGVASKIAGRFSATGEDTINEFTAGLSASAQALIGFPNKIGKSLAIGLGAGAITSTFDTWMKGLGSSQKQFELLESQTQKVMLTLDSITQTLGNFDNLITDSNVSMETLIREQRNLAEQTAQLQALPGGQDIAAEIAGATSSQGKEAAIAQYKSQQTRQLDSAANLLGLQQYTANRGFKLPFVGYQSNNPVGYSNDADKLQITQLLQGNASSAIADMGAEFKKSLLDAVGDSDAFKAILNNGSPDATRLNARLGGIKAFGGQATSDAVLGQIRSNLANEAVLNSPRSRAAIGRYQDVNAATQLRLDSALRTEGNLRRLFVNQGSLRAENAIDIRAFQQRGGYQAGLTGLAQRQGQAGLLGLQFGEITTRTFEAQTESQRIENERRFKTQGVQQNLARSVAGQLTANFDQNLKQVGNLKDIAVGRNILLPKSSEWAIAFTSALNKGIGSVFENGNLEQFNNKEGQFDYSKFTAAVANASSNDKNTQSNVSEWVKNNIHSIDVLNSIKNANNEMVGIQQDSLGEQQRNTAALEALKAEVNFKQLAGLLGGSKSLEDRESRRTLERNTVRGLTLATKGVTPEARGFGAQLYLKTLQETGQKIDAADPLTKKMLDIAEAGLADVQRKMTSRIEDSIDRQLGGGSTEATGFRQLIGKRTPEQAAHAAIFNQFHPENAGIINTATGAIDIGTKQLKSSVDGCSTAIIQFGKQIEVTTDQLTKAMINVAQERQSRDNQLNQAKGEVVGTTQQELKDKNVPNPIGGLTRSNPWQGQLPAIVTGGVSAAAAAASLYLQFRNNRALKNLGGGIGAGADMLRNYEESRPGILSRAGDFLTKERQNPITAYRNASKQDVINRYLSTKTLHALGKNSGAESESAIARAMEAEAAALQEQYPILQPAPSRGRGTIREPVLPHVNSESKKFLRDLKRQQYRPGGSLSGVPALGFAGGGGIPGGVVPFGGGFNKSDLLGFGLSQVLYSAGAAKGGLAGDALMLGSSFAPNLIGGLGKGIAGTRAVLSGGSLLAGGAAGIGGTVALGAAVGYGAFKGTQYLRNKATGIDKLADALDQNEDQTVKSTANYIMKGIKSGKSVASLQSYVQGQINTTQGQLSTTSWHGIPAGLLGLGSQSDTLRRSLLQLEELKKGVGEAKENYDEEHRAESQQDSLIKAIEKLADSSDKGGSTNVTSQINVEISLKDADKMPDIILNKLITPLKKDLEDLRNDINILRAHSNVTPQPAKV